MKLRHAGMVIGLAAFGTAGCASIMHGTTQKIGISSVPTGANVAVDNKPLGHTPLFADLKRKNEHIVTIEMPGYEKQEITLTRSVSGWVWGNIVFGGLIGLAVDAVSGGLYQLSPKQVTAQLRKSDAVASFDHGGLIVVAVMKPDPAWRKVGTLTAATVY